VRQEAALPPGARGQLRRGAATGKPYAGIHSFSHSVTPPSHEAASSHDFESRGGPTFTFTFVPSQLSDPVSLLALPVQPCESCTFGTGKGAQGDACRVLCRTCVLPLQDPGLNQNLISSAHTVAQLFNQDSWERHRQPGRYLTNLKRIGHSTVLRRIWTPVMVQHQHPRQHQHPWRRVLADPCLLPRPCSS
jgi:hypothetical protein